MNCFQLIKTVLKELYDKVRGTNEDKDEAIKKELVELRRLYSNISSNGCLDYSRPERRFAYVYCYVTAHANLVYQKIAYSSALQKIFNSDVVQIACIGGGPGSDFLGVLKYCDMYEKKPKLKCLLFDRDPSWGECWEDVDAKIGTSLNIMTSYKPMDVTNPDSWSNYSKYLNSDLFTLIYFMSEVEEKRKEADEYFNFLFANVKKNAHFLFVDNNDSNFYGWFDDLAKTHGIKIIAETSGRETTPYDEEHRDLSPYTEMFGSSPKLEANVACRVGIKVKKMYRV
jgi:hypothetical protein